LLHVLVFPRLRVKQNLGTIIFDSLSHNEEHKDTSLIFLSFFLRKNKIKTNSSRHNNIIKEE
jgi:hypothetical protein